MYQNALYMGFIRIISVESINIVSLVIHKINNLM